MKKRIVISFVFIVFCLMFYISVKADNITSLDTPINLVWKNDSTATAQWDAVANANYYFVNVYVHDENNNYVNMQETGTTNTEIDLQQEISYILNNSSMTNIDKLYYYFDVRARYFDDNINVESELSSKSDAKVINNVGKKEVQTPTDLVLNDNKTLSFKSPDGNVIDYYMFYYKITYNNSSKIAYGYELLYKKNLTKNNDVYTGDVSKVLKYSYDDAGYDGETVEIALKIAPGGIVYSYNDTYKLAPDKFNAFSDYSNFIFYNPNGSTVINAITLSPNAPVIAVGRSIYIGKTIQPENAYYSYINWATSDNSIVSINNMGQITGVKKGNAIISTKINNATQTANVSVYEIDSNINNSQEQIVIDKANDIIENIIKDSNSDGTDIENVNSAINEIETGAQNGNIFSANLNVNEKNKEEYTFLENDVHNQHSDMTIGGGYDVTVEISHMDNSNQKHHIGNILEFDEDITFTLDVLDNLPILSETKKREYALMRYHNGVLEDINITFNNNVIETSSDSFSDFILLYKDIDIPVESINVDSDSVTIIKGQSETIGVTILPSNAANKKYSSVCNNESVATVEGNVITAVGRGNAKVTFETEDGKFTKEVNVTVVDPKVLSITTNKDNYSVNVDDETFNIDYNVQVQDNPKYIVEITSSNTNIATVDNTGKVTIKNPGETIITITAGGIEKKVNINIYSLLKSVNLDKSEINMLINQTEQLIATINPKNTTEDKTLTYSSSDESIVTVDANGKITSVGTGTAIITVKTSNNKTAQCEVNVLSEIETKTEHVTINVKESAKVGERITIIATTEKGYKVSNVRILRKSDNKDITDEVNYSNYQFTMPKYNIIIEIDTIYLALKTPVISVIKGNNNTLIINWDKQEAEKYILYRSTNGKNWTKLIEIKTNTYTNSGLKYGTTYYYKVIAYNSYNGNTKYSNVVKMKVVPNEVTLSIKSAGTNSVKIGYDKVSATGYEVYMGTKSSNMKKVTTITKNSTINYNKTKLKANTTYFFKVRAYKKVGSKKVYGSWSNVVSTKTAPDKPGLKLSLYDLGSINYSITASKGANKYVIEESLDGKSYDISFSVTEAKTYTFESLDFGKTYYFRVRACNSENRCSGWTTGSLKLTTKTPSISLKTSSKKVTVTLGSVDGADGYEVYRSNYKNKKFSLVKSLTSSDELTFDNGTKKGKTYYYKVRSYKIVDGKKVYSPYSSVMKIKSK